MIRKIIGWILAIISTILLLLTIGVGIYGYSSSKIEVATTVFQSGIAGFFVFMGLSILLLKKQQNSNNGLSWWYKTRRILGYIFLILFLFSIPGIQYFDIYEILPRVLILITAYFLLKSYNTKQSSNTKEKMFNSRTNIRIEDNNVKEHRTTSEWSLKSERYFTQEEIDEVSHAIVVPSQYGNSVEFTMKLGGRCTYIPLDKGSNITVGEIVDMKQAILLTLEKEGESDIVRVKI
ncbi:MULTISPECIES: hypothetical protein [Bacteroides]|jgi:hypothetical protein|uniref:Uncharacterized protein n=1 Tax=Bacteroides cellulosilyticus CL02T12C19 TaxID=997874 RepID=I9QK24_9BACE|nr:MULTISPECIES: hypothetical protein [Bacteroides]EIY29866.1 hypothetical protein HMPREF1062_03075 [Bacteroides cellulosilyticus CL02T12C19]MCB6592273.1 hypothetical protein [Bacteroides cellulosilyticus]HCY70392.1 hypothetical protein [Bacteroides cellulosilyticus]